MEVKEVKKRKNNYLVRIDDDAIIVSPAMYIKHGSLTVNETITKEAYEKLLFDANEALAYEKALNKLSTKARSKLEMENYLKKLFPPLVVKSTVEKLTLNYLLDDFKYAFLYYDYAKKKQFGTKRIIYELKLKGINDEIISEVVSAHEDDVISVVPEVINKIVRSYKGSKANLRLKLHRQLTLKGHYQTNDLVEVAVASYDELPSLRKDMVKYSSKEDITTVLLKKGYKKESIKYVREEVEDD